MIPIKKTALFEGSFFISNQRDLQRLFETFSHSDVIVILYFLR